LISTGEFKAINALCRQGRLKAREPEIASRIDDVADENAARAATEIEDDRDEKVSEVMLEQTPSSLHTALKSQRSIYPLRLM
jgi:hypothetical protein